LLDGERESEGGMKGLEQFRQLLGEARERPWFADYGKLGAGERGIGEMDEAADAALIVQAVNAAEAFAEVAEKGQAFSKAYAHASIADEEGLASVEDFRTAWKAADEAAKEFDAALAHLNEKLGA